MSDPVTAYQDVLRKLEAARQFVTKTLDQINSVLKLMENNNWKQVRLLGQSQLTTASSNLGMTVDFRSCPSIEQLSQALTDYSKYRESAFAAWKAVPSERQIGLRPPADFV